jgi:hypothetical protein
VLLPLAPVRHKTQQSAVTMQEVGDLLRRMARAVIVSGLVLYLLMHATAMLGNFGAPP